MQVRLGWLVAPPAVREGVAVALALQEVRCSAREMSDDFNSAQNERAIFAEAVLDIPIYWEDHSSL